MAILPEQLLESVGFNVESRPLCEYSAQVVCLSVAELRHSAWLWAKGEGFGDPRGTESLATAYSNLGRLRRSTSVEVQAEVFPALRRALELRTPAP
jgi:hypothetical protein